MPIHRIILNDGSERSELGLDELQALFEDEAMNGSSLAQERPGEAWKTLGSIIDLKRLEKRFSVILPGGEERQQLSERHLKKLLSQGVIADDSPVFDRVDGRWQSFAARFNTSDWSRPDQSDSPEPVAATIVEEPPLPDMTPSPEISGKTDEQLAEEGVGQPDLFTFVTPELDGEDRSRRLLASKLLFLSTALGVLWELYAAFDGFTLLNTTSERGAMLWNLIVAIGLIRGGDGWRRFAVFRAAVGLLFGMTYFANQTNAGVWYGCFQIAWCLSFLWLLWGPSTSHRRQRAAVWCLVAALAGTYATSVFAVILPEYRNRAQIRAYGQDTTRISDPKLGYDIVVPSGWIILKPENPYIQQQDAKMAAAYPRFGALAVFLAEPVLADIRSLDDYVDRIEINLRDHVPTVAQKSRTTRMLRNRQIMEADLVFSDSGRQFSGLISVVREGCFYDRLRGWYGREQETSGRDRLQELQNSIQVSSQPAEEFAIGLERGMTENPLLTPEIAKIVTRTIIWGNYAIMDLAGTVDKWSEAGRSSLTQQEKAQMDSLYGHAFSRAPSDGSSVYLESLRRN